MGIWGKSLLENDLARDVYDTYSKISDESNYEKAYRYVLDCFSDVLNTDEEPVLWYALAFAQYKKGHMIDEVRQRVINWNSSKNGYSFLDDKSLIIKWKKFVSDLLKKDIVSNTDSFKKKKQFHEYVDTWCIGDVYAYKLNSKSAEAKGWKSKLIVMQKIGNTPFNPTIYSSKSVPVVRIINYIFADISECFEYNNKSFLPLVTKEVLLYKKMNCTSEEYSNYYSSRLNIALDAFKQSDFPKNRLFYITNDASLINNINYKEGEYVNAFWTKMEDGWLIDCLYEWSC